MTQTKIGQQDPNDSPHGREGVDLREVQRDHLAAVLRDALGLHPNQPAEGETAATFGRALPSVFRQVDVGGWIAWAIVGLPLFAEGFPTMARLRTESRRVVLVLAMLRAAGNLSATAWALAISRKVLRDNLRRLGL